MAALAISVVVIIGIVTGFWFLIAWGIQSLKTERRVKGTVILLVAGAIIFFICFWLYKIAVVIMVGKMGMG